MRHRRATSLHLNPDRLTHLHVGKPDDWFLLEDRGSISYDAQYSAWLLGFPLKTVTRAVNPWVDVTKSDRN